MKRNIYDLGDGEFAAAIAATAFAIRSLEENAGSQNQTKAKRPVIRPPEAGKCQHCIHNFPWIISTINMLVTISTSNLFV